jgi:hypothetical protein
MPRGISRIRAAENRLELEMGRLHANRADAPLEAASQSSRGGGYWWRGWEHLLYCVETGGTAIQKEFGMTPGIRSRPRTSTRR